MKKILLDKNKKFYKGNMHCHSTFSDGNQTPEDLKKAYKGAGYSFLAITDHEVVYDHSYLDDEEFITIPSTEYSIKEDYSQSTLKNFNLKVCHLNAYAKKQHDVNNSLYSVNVDHYSSKEKKEEMVKKYGDYCKEYSANGVNELIKRANDMGYFVAYNHPRWSLDEYNQYINYEGLWAVEIFNTACNNDGLYGYETNVLDDYLKAGKKIFASCGDDNHDIKNSFGAFVMVNAESLTYEKIIEGLLNGNFYTSTGPIINSLIIEDGIVKIECENAKKISLSTRGRKGFLKSAGENEFINYAEFKVLKDYEFFRIDVIDEKGRRANTQPYYLKDLL